MKSTMESAMALTMESTMEFTTESTTDFKSLTSSSDFVVIAARDYTRS